MLFPPHYTVSWAAVQNLFLSWPMIFTWTTHYHNHGKFPPPFLPFIWIQGELPYYWKNFKSILIYVYKNLQIQVLRYYGRFQKIAMVLFSSSQQDMESISPPWIWAALWPDLARRMWWKWHCTCLSLGLKKPCNFCFCWSWHLPCLLLLMKKPGPACWMMRGYRWPSCPLPPSWSANHQTWIRPL